MKIVIKTFVKGGNHGQYLQALGTHKVFRDLFPNAHIFLFDYENHFTAELLSQIKNLTVFKFLWMRYLWKKSFKFTKNSADVDIVVYGSDMIWYSGSNMFPLDREYFGINDKCQIKIAFSPSAGTLSNSYPSWLINQKPVMDMCFPRDNNTLRFTHRYISVPESNIVEHFDPCLYLDRRPISMEQRRPVVTVYAYYAASKVFAKAVQNLKIEYYAYYPKYQGLLYLWSQFTGPNRLLDKIGSSNLLITSTFHGVMMALLTKTPFILIGENPTVRTRLEGIVSSCFDGRRIIYLQDLPKVLEKSEKWLYRNDDINLEGLEKVKTIVKAKIRSLA